MEICPTLWHNKLNYAGHDQKTQGGEPSPEANNQQYWKHDLRYSDQMRDDKRHREGVCSAKNVKLELVLEKVCCAWRERQKAVPARQS